MREILLQFFILFKYNLEILYHYHYINPSMYAMIMIA